MKINRYDEVKDKVVGGSMEVFGDLIDDEEMEYKGKLKMAKGKVKEVSNDVLYELEDVRDKLVGSAKEVVGKYSDNRDLHLEGMMQKAKATSPYTNKIIGGFVVILGLLTLNKYLKKEKSRKIKILRY